MQYGAQNLSLEDYRVNEAQIFRLHIIAFVCSLLKVHIYIYIYKHIIYESV